MYHMDKCLEGQLDPTSKCECQRENMVAGPLGLVSDPIKTQQTDGIRDLGKEESYHQIKELRIFVNMSGPNQTSCGHFSPLE